MPILSEVLAPLGLESLLLSKVVSKLLMKVCFGPLFSIWTEVSELLVRVSTFVIIVGLSSTIFLWNLANFLIRFEWLLRIRVEGRCLLLHLFGSNRVLLTVSTTLLFSRPILPLLLPLSCLLLIPLWLFLHSKY